MRGNCKTILCALGLLFLLAAGWAEEPAAPEEDFYFPPDTLPLTDQEDVNGNLRYLVPLSCAGLAAGVCCLVGGVIAFSLNATYGYGSAEFNRGVILLNAGILLAAISGTYLQAILAGRNTH